MFGTTTTISSTSNKNQQSVSAKHVSGTRAKMKYHTLSTSSIASEGKKSTLTIYADMDLNHDKLESELVAARRELEGVQKALHKQTQRCRELVAEFSRKLQSKDIQIQTERQLRDQQLTKVLRALLLFEARLVQEQKIIRQQLNEKDNIIRYQQIQIRKLQSFNENYCQSSNLESLESSSDLYGFQESNNRYNQNHDNRVSNFESLDSSSEIYATVSEKDYKHDNSTSSEDAGNKTDCDSLTRGGTYVKNKQNYTKLNDKRTKKYGNSRKNIGTYVESLRRRETCIDSSSNDEVSSNEHESEMRNVNGNVTDHIDKVSHRIENIFTDTKNIVTTSHKFSEKMDSLHGIKPVRHSREASDEAYTSSSISGSSSSTSTNYCSPGDIRGSYEPNGNFNCNSSTKSESELTTTYSESTKHNDGGDSVSLEIYELHGDIYDNTRTVNKNCSNNNNDTVEKQHPNDENNDISSKNNFQNTTDNRFVFDKNDSESNENWYASASDQEEDQKCEIYKNNPVLECMNQILLHNIHDPINSPPKSPVPITKSKSPKRVKFFDENNSVVETKHAHNEINSPHKKTGNGVNSISPAPSQESNYYETPIQGVANVYEVPQSIYSNDYEQILINCNDGFQSWPNSMKSNSSPGKIENLQEKEVNRMAQQKLSVAKNSNFDSLDNKNNYYYVDMDSRVIDNRTGQSIIRKCKLSRTPPALPPKPANLVSKYKIQTRKFNEHHEHVDNMTSTIDIEPDYCSISELNLTVENDNGQIGNEVVQQSTNITSLYDQIIANASNPQQNKTLKQVSTERTPSMSNGTHTKSKESKTSKTLDIPMLPQVSEIIIPSESESEAKEECITQDNYIKNNSQMLKQKTSKSSPTVHDKYKSPIQIGVSVSSLITGFNNQHILSEINNRKPPTPKNKLPEHVFSNFEPHQNYDKQQTPLRSSDNSNSSKAKPEIHSFEKFDLSQNFEEFRLDDCEIGEEYHISMDSEDKEHERTISNVDTTKTTTSSHSIEKEQNKNNEAVEKSDTRNLNSAKKHLSVSVENILGLKTIPGLNSNRNGYQKPISTIQHSMSSPSKRSPSKVPVLKPTSSFQQHKDNYEQFLECTGLSSKSILTPSRLLSNHKAMLKPKDVKLRDRVRSTVMEKHGSTVKYYSEPYL